MNYINNKLIEFEKSLKSKKIAIVGLGVSNIPLLDYFSNKEAFISVFDKSDLPLDLKEKINKYGYLLFTGENYLSNLNGFDIIFRAPSILPTIPEFIKEKENGAIITTEIEQLLKYAPCGTIGITGTEGKTTTSSIINAIINKSNIKCYLGGNIGTPLFTKLNEITPNDIIILELSSFQLMGMEVSPNIAVVTNIFPDHLNVHSSLEEYINAKETILLNQISSEKTILNFDNEVTKNFEKDAIANCVFFSSKVSLKDGYFYDKNTGYIKFGNQNIIHKNDIKLRGIHNYENICAALAATSSIVDTSIQIEAIKNFIGVEHRLEFVRELNGVKYYNDSIGTSPASTIAGLNSFDENIILLAGGSDKGLDYKEIGEKIAQKVGTLILTGPTSTKIKEATLNAKASKYPNIIDCNNLEEAVLTANKLAINGDIVLLSPASASFDAFKNFMERGKKFKECVNKLN